MRATLRENNKNPYRKRRCLYKLCRNNKYVESFQIQNISESKANSDV